MEELVDLAESVGLSGREAKSVLESRTHKETVDRDWSRCNRIGITGVPTFAANRQAVVGFQSYEGLEQFLKTCGL